MKLYPSLTTKRSGRDQRERYVHGPGRDAQHAGQFSFDVIAAYRSLERRARSLAIQIIQIVQGMPEMDALKMRLTQPLYDAGRCSSDLQASFGAGSRVCCMTGGTTYEAIGLELS